jgi:hypothetical protein
MSKNRILSLEKKFVKCGSLANATRVYVVITSFSQFRARGVGPLRYHSRNERTLLVPSEFKIARKNNVSDRHLFPVVTGCSMITGWAVGFDFRLGVRAMEPQNLSNTNASATPIHKGR